MTDSEKIPWKRLTAEGAAIVVSILLALSIDAWWEDREQEQQLIGNLQALEEEMEFNHHLINADLEYIPGIFEKMDGVFRALVTQDASALPDEFLIDVGMGYTIRAIEVTNSAYDAVVSPENLRLIGNPELRSSLIKARQASWKSRQAETYSGPSTPSDKDPFLQVRALSVHSVGSSARRGWCNPA